VTGRGPGKRALQFERSGDNAALTIPGEFQQVTFAAWLKTDRLENTVNAVMNSTGSWAGSVHWQLDRKDLNDLCVRSHSGEFMNASLES
jgi:hypothetical protein